MDKCIFCNSELSPGSPEHVFLSAIGGRLTTRRAICQSCNNAFADDRTGKIDDSLARSFVELRNGLKIWSGRKDPPPTLKSAGKFADGEEFDLAPGFAPIAQPGKASGKFDSNNDYVIKARDEEDAIRLIEILKKRGLSFELGTKVRVEIKAPPVVFRVGFMGPKVWRGIAKTAAVGFVVLHGNEKAREILSADLMRSIRFGEPGIENFAGWDFNNSWPEILSVTAHKNSPDATLSGFEHQIIISDVSDKLVGYVSLFGKWRFSVVLGPRSNLPPRGLAINPRSSKPSRFEINASAPLSYLQHSENSFKDDHPSIRAGVSEAFNFALSQWRIESEDEYYKELLSELDIALCEAGDDIEKWHQAVLMFSTKVAQLELGDGWETSLGSLLNADNP